MPYAFDVEFGRKRAKSLDKPPRNSHNNCINKVLPRQLKENLFEAARSDEKLRSAAFDTSCAMDEILWRLKDLSLIHNDISELISVGCGFGDVAGDLKNVSDKTRDRIREAFRYREMNDALNRVLGYELERVCESIENLIYPAPDAPEE